MNSPPTKVERESQLAQHYQEALQRYLNGGDGTNTARATELGGDALPIGLEILDMARIHETALVSLVLPKCSSRTRKNQIKKAGSFFAKAILPLEETHHLAQEIDSHLNQFVTSLNQRTLELADSVEMLSLDILRRQTAEQSLRASEQTSSDLLEKSRKLQHELRELSHQLLKAQEEERMKISRELHDVIAQTLTSINLQLDILRKQSSADNRQLHQRIRNTQLMVENSVQIVHRFACELRPTVLDDLGLIPALKSFLKGFMAESGIHVRLSISANVEREDISIRTALYRVAQEALTNVSRHAKSPSAMLQIHSRNGQIRMKIHDDGQGFDEDNVLEGKMSRRLGLLGMRERIEMVGGKFSIQTAIGKFTTVCAEIPSSVPPNRRPPPPTAKRTSTRKSL